MLRRSADFWDRQSLTTRLLAIASAALLLAGLLILLFSARQEAQDGRRDLDLTLAYELESLPPVLGEVAIIGDYASLQQILDRYAARAQVAAIEYVDMSGTALKSNLKQSAAGAPDWFLRFLDFHDVSGHTRISIGGRNYGELKLTLTAAGMAHRAWQRLLDRSAILLLAVVLDFLIIWQSLRVGLEPIKRLERGADAIADGALITRLEVAGSPELRHVITAFNRMADATQHAVESTHQSNANLIRFAEVSAHHLMEPTRRLSSYAQRLRTRLGALAEPCRDAEVLETLDTLERDAGRLRGLVRDIQLYLAASQPRGEVRSENVEEALAALTRRLSARFPDLATILEIAPPLPPAVLDKPRLTDLFSVLIENAVCHGRPAGPGQAPHISISGERLGSTSRYRVCDNGPGIPAQYQERVFEIFERLNSSSGGSGIGLSIARHIVESRHGKIHIESLAQGGAMVVFDLPDGG